MIKFERASTLGRGTHIKVLSTTRGLHPIGRITEGQDKVYRYYEPYSNELNPTYSHTDLEDLEEVVRHRRS